MYFLMKNYKKKSVKKNKNFQKKVILSVDTFFRKEYINYHRRTKQVRMSKEV